ncbi:PALP domain-containing protein [Trichophyton interdigitale]|uniref:Cysteine synthase 2 n=1 Tax=Trichophyton interdigitale TaxID=101480 RepID=A0A9P5D1S9_9EURO|nr:PALP domain-containing protein [Trichophyton interdigitale]KAF3900928.1 PALP domain-containing protein [Trichophyton interdigitale]KAG8212573.1 PALP domain-containing protein [Trichophyton interdigitale]
MEASSRMPIYVAAAFATGAICTIAIDRLLRSEGVISQTEPGSKETMNGLSIASGIEYHGLPKTPQPPPIVDGIEGCIGNTPMVRIRSLSEATGCEILAKAEFLNGAGGSPKDRVALSMIQEAEANGLLTPFVGDAIYEGTVGSTGISLATLARARGYLAHICMPSDQSTEKSNLLLKLGAVVDRVTPAPIVETGHFVNRARSLAHSHGKAEQPSRASSPFEKPNIEALTSDAAAKQSRGFFADQFENSANWQAHYRTTGPEIYVQCEGKLDAFVAGAGTGGTISGVARYLKPRVSNMIVVLADPQGSGLYNRVRYGVMFDTKEREGTRRRQQVDSIVEGIGINRVTANFEAGRELVDDAVRVTDAQAIAMARWLVEKDGIFIGSSSAVNCFAAVKTALKLGPGHKVVTILCDSGTRHLSKFWAEAGNVGGAVGTKLEDVLNAKE